MYPVNTAALLSYLVLCLIECDILGRQKSRLIQSNKLPWAKCQMQSKGAAALHNIALFLFTFSFNGLFFQHTLQKINWPEKSRSYIFNVSILIEQIILVVLSWMFNRRKKFHRRQNFGLPIASWCAATSCQTVTHSLVGFCTHTWLYAGWGFNFLKCEHPPATNR